jgi:hypothetical protein
VSLRLRVACRPVLGLLIRGRAVPVPVPTCVVLRDRRTGAYVADPYGTGDRRGRYSTSVAGAYRFVREDLARRAADDMGGGFDTVTLVLSDIPP